MCYRSNYISDECYRIYLIIMEINIYPGGAEIAEAADYPSEITCCVQTGQLLLLSLRIDTILTDIPFQGTQNIIRGAGGHRIAGFMGGGADMRHQHHIIQ